MATMFESRHLSVRIACDPRKVYQFVSDPHNFPRWATSFCTGVRHSESDWLIETPQGTMTFRFVEGNEFGVLDHYVTPAPGMDVYVPMRVIANGDGSEVIFTLLRTAQVSDEMFEKDSAMVRQDLDSLKRVLEGDA